ncbi:MAG: hypothetical protein L6R39_004459 [Caloplaca ligustica]|nr:MAG: hypothetical protein L6R39_004459 [Caloplaca ligustica]
METYHGHVRTPADAIILFEACRLGTLPRVQRRLSEKERQSIKSGSVFVWDEREAGMRRWTDGKSWSASRVSGSFLTYREMEGKRGGNGLVPPLAASRAGKTPESARGSDSDVEVPQEDGPDGYRYKPDGLMKQSFSITTSSGNHLHLISYYSRSHPSAQTLNNPTTDPSLRHIRPQKGMYPESTVHEQQSIPAVTRAPMVSTAYSTNPHMAGYARGPPPPPPPPPQGPPQHYAPAGYGWTQPPNVAPYPAYGYHYGPPAMPTNGHSPLSYSQSVQAPPSYPSAPPHYDRSPNTYSDGSLPFAHQRTSSSGNGMPHYPQHSPHPPHQHPSQHPPQQPSPHGSQPPPPLPPNHQQQAVHGRDRPASSTPPVAKIDPRLMVPSSLPQQTSCASSHSRSPSPMPPRQESSNSTPTQTTNGASSIPSIDSLVNGSNGTQNPEAQSDRSNRSASRSPGGTKKAEGPKDIPGDKMGFVEDKRALRVLDRAFKT